MKDYIYLNGQKIELTEEQAKEISKSYGVRRKLSDIKESETFRIGKYEFVVLEQFGDITAVLLKNLLHNRECFGKKNNNYNGSIVDDLCKDFGQKIADIVGEDNLIEHMVDLTANDGLKDYGNIKRKMSLLTATQYRKYVGIIDEFQINNYWWLSTAFSTVTHGDDIWVLCVAPSGFIDRVYCSGNNYGVRPFCILKSDIFVSK